METPPEAGPCPFVVRMVVIEPGRVQSFDEAQWRDAIVVVDNGEIELECQRGSRHPFRRGDLLWLVGLELKAIHNPGKEPATLIAVSRSNPAQPIPTHPGYAPAPKSYLKGYLS
jgi:hypothetical protein